MLHTFLKLQYENVPIPFYILLCTYIHMYQPFGYDMELLIIYKLICRINLS